MEARKITVVSTRTSTTKTIMSRAETLRQLKEDLDREGISYEDLTFYEGLTKTELRTDDSILPTNVPYEGTTTNELVFMLTNTNKKIRSGAEINNRFDAGKYFRENPEAAVDFKQKHDGKNWTNCTTEEILEYFQENVNNNDSLGNLVDAINDLISVLYDYEIIESSDYRRLTEKVNNTGNGIESPYSQSEIDDMFRNID